MALNQQHNQYELIVKDGAVVTESGVFFKAAPFRITPRLGLPETQVVFKRNAAYSVVYQLTCDQNIIELHHPDYAPELSPDKLGEHTDVFAALVRLGITKTDDYNQFFASYTPNYTVLQPVFLPT